MINTLAPDGDTRAGVMGLLVDMIDDGQAVCVASEDVGKDIAEVSRYRPGTLFSIGQGTFQPYNRDRLAKARMENGGFMLHNK